MLVNWGLSTQTTVLLCSHCFRSQVNTIHHTTSFSCHSWPPRDALWLLASQHRFCFFFLLIYFFSLLLKFSPLTVMYRYLIFCCRFPFTCILSTKVQSSLFWVAVLMVMELLQWQLTGEKVPWIIETTPKPPCRKWSSLCDMIRPLHLHLTELFLNNENNN